ncbi:MAG: hypothetical protein OXN84_12350 [Albidovulum sp.]|nr:hypothetical protein [Albidovulum sp.]
MAIRLPASREEPGAGRRNQAAREAFPPPGCEAPRRCRKGTAGPRKAGKAGERVALARHGTRRDARGAKKPDHGLLAEIAAHGFAAPGGLNALKKADEIPALHLLRF